MKKAFNAIAGLARPFFRLTPPKPREIDFPSLNLLFGEHAKKETPDSLPWWHVAMRLGIPALLAAGLAWPNGDSSEPVPGKGPLMLVVDDGWAAAKNWATHVEAMNRMIDNAAYDGRQIVLLGTAPHADGTPLQASAPLDSINAKRMLRDMHPQAWPADNEAAVKALEHMQPDGTSTVIWATEGIEETGAHALLDRLGAFGPVTMLEDAAQTAPLMLSPAEREKGKLAIAVNRPEGGPAASVMVIGSDMTGNPVDQAIAKFAPGETVARAVFNIPENVNARQIARIVIENESSAGATLLLDEQWRHRPVGVVNANVTDTVQRFLSASYYINNALGPYADMHNGTVAELLKRELSVMILSDDAVLDTASRKAIENWVGKGGVLLRFAGPNLAGNPNDTLLPVKLREGERSLGGGISWEKPQHLAPFAVSSPFSDLAPPDDVTVQTEVMADQGPETDAHVWARLEDGTPFITHADHGKGQIVLVHTTANTDWSNLPLSGLFIGIMRDVIKQSQAASNGADNDGVLPPLKTLDGAGQFTAPALTVRPLVPGPIDGKTIGPQHPPGFYGNNDSQRALNLYQAAMPFAAARDLPKGVGRQVYQTGKDNNVSGWLFAAMAFLLALEGAVTLKRSGALAGSGNARRPSPGADKSPS